MFVAKRCLSSRDVQYGLRRLGWFSKMSRNCFAVIYGGLDTLEETFIGAQTFVT